MPVSFAVGPVFSSVIYLSRNKIKKKRSMLMIPFLTVSLSALFCTYMIRKQFA